MRARRGEPVLEFLGDGEFLVLAPASALEQGSWALYDFANTVFSMNIVTLYFAVWLVAERGASNTSYSVATSLSSLAVLLTAPVLGARSDASRRRKPWVVGLTLACVGATLLLDPLGRLPAGSLVSLLLLLAAFALANTAYQLALPFYNAMMPELVPASRQGWLSGLGTAVGYAGSIAGVLLVAPFVTGIGGILRPRGRQGAFLPTGIFFLLFCVPFFLFCHDHLPPARERARPAGLRANFGQLREAFRDAGRHAGLRRFVLTSYLYQDALGTAIAFMALYAVRVLGLAAGAEIRLFVILTLPAILGSYLAGLASDRFGPLRTLRVVLWGWFLGLLAVALAPSLGAFWAGGAVVGFSFGGIWATERPLLLTLAPEREAGRFFGLLALSARAAAIAGPLVWALEVDWVFRPLGAAAAYRLAVGTLAAFMLGALVLLGGVPDRRRGGSLRR
jgi:UMF1 family MFS transporter